MIFLGGGDLDKVPKFDLWYVSLFYKSHGFSEVFTPRWGVV